MYGLKSACEETCFAFPQLSKPESFNMRRREKETVTSRWSRLVFDGDEKNHELWETKFLGHLYLQGLKETILSESFEEDEEDAAKNAEAYAELIQLLDDKSLSLVMREAADDGRAALKILREYYAGKGKPRVISLYTELTSLQKSPVSVLLIMSSGLRPQSPL